MRARHPSASWLVAIVSLVVACSFEVDYSGSRYACDPDRPLCPGIEVCSAEGLCLHPDELPGHDEPDAGPEPEPDAAVIEPPVDAAPPGPDAQTLFTFQVGDRLTSDVKGVTTDTFLDNSQQNTNFGADDIIDADQSPLRRALVRFDLSQLPAGAKVLDAKLQVYVENPIDEGDLELAPLTEAWAENEATWRNRVANTTWKSAGGTAGASVAKFAPRAEGAYDVPLPAATVQGWLDTPASNFGLRFSSTSQNGRGAQMTSRNSILFERRPQLLLVVSVPAPTTGR
jgi:hypothetical protein